MKRFDFLKKSIPLYLNNSYVTELIITDETGEDYEAIVSAFSHPKLRVYKNERRLGSLENKQRVASYATSDYIAILDSDNYADLQYFRAFHQYIQTHQITPYDIYLPCHAMPEFNYERFIGKSINRFTVRSMWPDIDTCLNTMNMIIPRAFLSQFNIMQDKPMCDNASGAHDAHYFSLYAIFNMNANMIVVPEMKYYHTMHDGSWYRETVHQSKPFFNAMLERFFPKNRMTLLEWQNLPKQPNELIIQASSTNEDDAWMPFPIGMCYHYPFQSRKGTKNQFGNHTNTAMLSINTWTDSKRRPTGKNRQSIANTLLANGIQNTPCSPDMYYESLPSYKFVISPEGNGIDCHRHYEALLAGCIPIVERNPLVEEKYRGCPILFTDDYSEITPAYLDAKYEEMKTAVYDFSRLFLDYYSPETQAEIKRCGNYWMLRLTGIPVYN